MKYYKCAHEELRPDLTPLVTVEQSMKYEMLDLAGMKYEQELVSNASLISDKILEESKSKLVDSNGTFKRLPSRYLSQGFVLGAWVCGLGFSTESRTLSLCMQMTRRTPWRGEKIEICYPGLKSFGFESCSVCAAAAAVEVRPYPLGSQITAAGKRHEIEIHSESLVTHRVLFEYGYWLCATAKNIFIDENPVLDCG